MSAAEKRAASVLGVGDAGDVVLPEDAVTQGFGILARRRSGKSNTLGVMEETFSERGDPWVCLDPVSAHWGIRYLDAGGRPGKASGYEVLVVGGKFGDVPLDEKAGAPLAQILVETGISCVIDLGEEKTGPMQRFAAEFAGELLRLNETPRHVFLEEAHVFVPQQLEYDDQKLVKGALSRLIRNGGGKGIGFTLCSQRPAAVAKDVLEQIDNLVVLRMNGPRDLKAVSDWFEHNVADKTQLAAIVSTLPGFKPGEAWLLSPDWLQAMTRIRVRERRTYHAGRTPKRGEKPVSVKRVELGKVIESYRASAARRQIAVAAERDLRVEVVELRKKLAASERVRAGGAAPAAAAAKCTHAGDIVRLERKIDAQERELAGAEKSQAELEAVVAVAVGALDDFGSKMAAVAKDLRSRRMRRVNLTPGGAASGAPTREGGAAAQFEPQARPLEGHALTRRVGPPPAPRPNPMLQALRDSTNGSAPADVDIDGGQRKLLEALRSFEPLGVRELHRATLAVSAGVSPRSGRFDKNVSVLRRGGLVEIPRAGSVALTADGRALTAEPSDVPTLEALHARWLEAVDGGQAKLLRVLIGVYPLDLDREQLALDAGVSPDSGRFDKNISQLRRLGVLELPSSGRVRATSLLFPEELVL